jgi:hypothetical protein
MRTHGINLALSSEGAIFLHFTICNLQRYYSVWSSQEIVLDLRDDRERENLSAQGALNLDSNCYNNLLQMVWLQILAWKLVSVQSLHRTCLLLKNHQPLLCTYRTKKLGRIQGFSVEKYVKSQMQNLW